jgi:hypothetical protein
MVFLAPRAVCATLRIDLLEVDRSPFMDRADASLRIDSYKFLPRSMIPEFKAFPYQVDDLVKASPSVSLKNARVALLTSAGLYLKGRQSSFDLDRERLEPFWGRSYLSAHPV